MEICFINQVSKKKKSISDLTNCSFCHCKWPRIPSRIVFLGYVIVGVISELIHEEIVRNFMRQRDGEAGSGGEGEGEKAGECRERDTQRPLGRNRAAAGLVGGVRGGKGRSIHLASGHHMAQSCTFASCPVPSVRP